MTFNIQINDTVNINSDRKIISIILNDFEFNIDTSPFSNCQLFSISNFDYLYASLYVNDSISNINKLLYEIKEKCNIDKKLLIVDIDISIFSKIKNYVNIYEYKKYINFTGTEMILCLIEFN